MKEHVLIGESLTFSPTKLSLEGSMAHTSERPNVFVFVDALTFIGAYIEYLKSIGKYSVRRFAKRAGFGSHDYMRFILPGKRKISEALITKLSGAFHLTEAETEYFKALVHFSQAKNENAKRTAWERMNLVRDRTKLRRLSYETYRFYHNWRIPVIFEGLRTHWKSSSISQIAKDLGVSNKEISDHLACLRELHLIEGDGENWRVKDFVIQSEREAHNQMIRGFHRVVLSKSYESAAELPDNLRKIFSLVMALPKDKMEEVAKELFEYLEEVNLRYGQVSNADAVYAIGFQIFPLHSFEKKLGE